jgi:TonB family protein
VSKDYVGQPAGGGNRFAWYGDLLLQEVKQLLAKNPKLRVGEYRVVVSVWITPEGRVSRTELAGSSGNGDIDALLRASLAELPPLRERPPEGLPWPIRLRVTSRL